MHLKDLLPVPDLLTCRRLLCVQPHPDDMEFSAGATLAMLADRGTEIHYLTVTDDTAGFLEVEGLSRLRRGTTRKEEQERAGGIIGVRGYHWLDRPDAGEWSTRDVRDRIIGHIRRIRPDFLMTVDPWLPYEAHLDHLKTGMAACEASFLYRLPSIAPGEDGSFETFSIRGVVLTWTDRPNIRLDVGAWKDRKRQALRRHESQIDDAFWESYTTYDDNRGAKEGEPAGAAYVESFKILPPQLLHGMPEAGGY